MKSFKFSFIILLFFLSCDTTSEKKIKDLERENELLKSQINSSRYIDTYRNNNNSSNFKSSYFEMNDKQLLNEFKNFLSDESFSFNSAYSKNKTIYIQSYLTDNVIIRRLQKSNELIFSAVLSRFNKIIFSSPTGDRIIVSNLD